MHILQGTLVFCLFSIFRWSSLYIGEALDRETYFMTVQSSPLRQKRFCFVQTVFAFYPIVSCLLFLLCFGLCLGPLFAQNQQRSFALPFPLELNAAPLFRLESGTFIVLSQASVSSENAKDGATDRELDQNKQPSEPIIPNFDALDFQEIKISQGRFSLDLQKTPRSQALAHPARTFFTGSKLTKVVIVDGVLDLFHDLGEPVALTIKQGVFDVDLDAGTFEGKGTLLTAGLSTEFSLSVAIPRPERRTRQKGDKTNSPALPKPLSLTLLVKNDVFTGRYSGNLAASKKLQLEGKTVLKVQDLRAFSGLLPLLLPGTSEDTLKQMVQKVEGEKNMALAGEGAVSWSGLSGSVKDAKFVFGAHKATGTLRLQLGEENPDLSGTLAYQDLDLGPLLFDVSPPLAEEGAPSPPLPFGFTELSQLLYGFIRHIDADLRVSAKRVLLGSVALEDAGFSLYQKKGALIVDLADAALFDGQANGHLKINTTTPKMRWHLNARLHQMNLAKLSGVLGAEHFLEGKGNIKLQLTSFGDKLTEFSQNLHGPVLFNVDEGGSIGLSMHLLHEAQTGSLKDSFTALFSGRTKFSHLTAASRFLKGKLVTDFARLATPSHEYTARGRLDLSPLRPDWYVASWRLDAALNEAETKEDAFVYHDDKKPNLLFCGHISGNWHNGLLERTPALNLALQGKSCPAVYRPEALHNKKPPIVRQDDQR